MSERQDTVRDLVHLREKIDGLFQDVLSRSSGAPVVAPAGAWRPPVDVWAQDDRYHLRIDLPGVTPESLTIEVESEILHVRGERRDAGVPRERMLRAERPHGRFSLAIALPPSCDPQGVEAHQREGVLEIALRRVLPAGAGRVRVALR
jgi:HSP20 family protein